MKRLILVRHGKAEPTKGNDFSRNLLGVGEERSCEVALRLKNMNMIPDRILSSAAIRTKQTAETISEVFWNDRDQVTPMPELYLADASILLEVIQQMDKDTQCLMMVGHNNGISELCTLLARSGTYLLKTSGVIVLDMNIKEWHEVALHNADPVWNYRLNMY